MIVKKTGYPNHDTRPVSTLATCPTCFTPQVVRLSKLDSRKRCFHCKKSFNTTTAVLSHVQKKKEYGHIKVGTVSRASYITKNFITLLGYSPGSGVTWSQIKSIFSKEGYPVFPQLNAKDITIDSLAVSRMGEPLKWAWEFDTTTAIETAMDTIATCTKNGKTYTVHCIHFARDPLTLFEARIDNKKWFVNVDFEYTLLCIEADNVELGGTLFLLA